MLSPRPFPRAEPWGWAQPEPSAAEADRLRRLSVPQKVLETMLLAPARRRGAPSGVTSTSLSIFFQMPAAVA